jgi:hypothetical protein
MAQLGPTYFLYIEEQRKTIRMVASANLIKYTAWDKNMTVFSKIVRSPFQVRLGWGLK